MSFTRISLRKTIQINYLTFNKFLNQIPNGRYSTTKLEDASLEDNKPIVYTKSAASRWQAKSSRMGTDSNRLWYEPHVLLGSIAVFMFYFCVFREESDIDQEFDKTLYQRIRGLEEKQLWLSLKYNEEHGLDTANINKRLRDIEKQREQQD